MDSHTANGSHSYSEQDIYVDPLPLTDSWGQFLSMRFSERAAFYESLTEPEQKLVSKELMRIDYFRDVYKNQYLAASDESPLASLLERSRKGWNALAYSRCQVELLKRQNDPGEARNCRILKAVHRRGGKPGDDGWSPTVSRSLANYNPAEPDYGYNGWLMTFKDGSRGIDDPRCYGNFPHQKISIRQLLYNKEETPLARSDNKKDLRYFHLPANNMTWVEEAISRYYGEEKLDFGEHRVLNARSKTERLLKHELWRGQQRGGIGMPIHARQIGARCSVVPSAPPDDRGPHSAQPTSSSGSSKSVDMALFMPYLHWEVEKRLLRMSKTVREQDSKQSRRFKTKFADLASNWRLKLDLPAPDEKREHAPWRPRSALGQYLWYAAKLFEMIDEAADERLIHEHLHSPSPLHLRRTLDQYYYWTVADTAVQDQNQVVGHGTRSSNDPGATSRVVMVDQLWMWILDENTIVTSFPRRWGRNKPDPSAVHRAIRDHFGRLDGMQKHNIYDLALVIIDECSRVFFDRTKPLDQRPEVVAIFGSAISDIAEMKTMAYAKFGRDVSTINARASPEDAEELIRKSLNISFEWSVLIEAQHIIDELQIMQEIFTQQIAMLRDFEKALKTLSVGPATLDRVVSLMRDIEIRRDELAGLEKHQAKTRAQVRELLDMKQQQAGIIEAKAAIKRADETVLQGRSIVVFTVFTIFFLPLSFLASVFGMNSKELNDGPMAMGTQFKYMFSLSSVVIFFSLAFAFGGWARTALSVGCHLVYAYLRYWLGVHKIKIKQFQPSAKLKEFEKKIDHDLQDKELQRRMAQIKQIKDAQAEQNRVGQERRGSWRTIMDRGINGRRSRKTTTAEMELS